VVEVEDLYEMIRVLLRYLSASAVTSSTINVTGQQSTYQVYCSICRRYVAEKQHHRCDEQSEDRSSAAPAAISTTVTAPEVAQHSVSRLQSNSASTVITVTGNNNSTVVLAAVTPATVPPSSNGTKGEDKSVIYRRYYECNVRVPYQTYINQSCHKPCQFFRVNQRHISCMEIHSNCTSAGGIPVGW
jgi:hypothetical protein